MNGDDLKDWDWLLFVLACMLVVLIVTVVANVSFVRLVELCFSGGCDRPIP